MSNTLMIFDSNYLEEQVKNFARIRQGMGNVELGLRRARVLDGFECRECREFSDEIKELNESLAKLRISVENIMEVFRYAVKHTVDDGEKAKAGADAMAEKMKAKYGMEASSYDPSKIFAGNPNKTLPVTPVPALANVIVSQILVGFEKIPWVKNATAMTLSNTSMYKSQEEIALKASFEAEAADVSILDLINSDEFRVRFRSYTSSLYADA